MNLKKIPTPSYNPQISALFFLLGLIFFSTVGLAVFFYPDPFWFWQHAISDLGDTISREGNPNGTSRWVYILGMVTNSLILLRIGGSYAKEPDLRNANPKRWLSFLGAVGFLVSMIPNNLHHTLHSVGAGIVIGVLYFLIMIFHFELKPAVSTGFFYINMAILQAGVFSYAWAFFSNAADKQIYQKICIISIFIALLRIAAIAKEGFHPIEILSNSERFRR